MEFGRLSFFTTWNFRKRSGSCRGKYNTAIYTQLDNICEDCYNLYKDPDVHHMCRYSVDTTIDIFTIVYKYINIKYMFRADCFSTDFFRGCLEALMLQEQEFLEMVQIIGK